LEQQKLQAVLNQYFSKLRQDLKSNDDQIIVYVFVPEPVSFYGSHQQQILKAWLYIYLHRLNTNMILKGTVEA